MRFSFGVRAAAAALLITTGLTMSLNPATPVSATSLDATNAVFQFGVTGQTVENVADLDRALQPPAAITYRGVATISATVIDAVVTFVEGANLIGNNAPANHIRRVDDHLGTGGTFPFIESEVRTTTNLEAWARIRVDFYLSGTSTPVTLTNLSAHFYDVDDAQSVEVSGATTHTLADNTHLTPSASGTGAIKFTSANVSTSGSSGTSYTVGRVTATYASTSTIEYRLFVPAGTDASFDVDISPGVAWVDNNITRTQNVVSAQPAQPVILPPAVAVLITQPVSPATPSTTTTQAPLPTTTQAPQPTTPPTPLLAPNGVLPELSSAETLVTENGAPITAELVVENDSDLVLRSQDFELRLRGACTTDCTITEDANGRETIHLDRNGAARVSGFGFLPGSLVHVWIFSEPRYLGALLVAPDGTYDGSFDLADIEVGGHTLQANGFSFDNVPRSANLGIVVVDNTAPTPGPTALPATGTNSTTAVLALALLALGTLFMGARRRRTVG